MTIDNHQSHLRACTSNIQPVLIIHYISYTITQATMGIKGLAKLLSDEAPDCIRDVSYSDCFVDTADILKNVVVHHLVFTVNRADEVYMVYMK